MALHSASIWITCDFFRFIDLVCCISTTKAQMDIGYSATWFFGADPCCGSYDFFYIHGGPIFQGTPKAHRGIRDGFGRIGLGVGIPSDSLTKGRGQEKARFRTILMIRSPKTSKMISISEVQGADFRNPRSSA